MSLPDNGTGFRCPFCEERKMHRIYVIPGPNPVKRETKGYHAQKCYGCGYSENDAEREET